MRAHPNHWQIVPRCWKNRDDVRHFDEAFIEQSFPVGDASRDQATREMLWKQMSAGKKEGEALRVPDIQKWFNAYTLRHECGENKEREPSSLSLSKLYTYARDSLDCAFRFACNAAEPTGEMTSEDVRLLFAAIQTCFKIYRTFELRLDSTGHVGAVEWEACIKALSTELLLGEEAVLKFAEADPKGGSGRISLPRATNCVLALYCHQPIEQDGITKAVGKAKEQMKRSSKFGTGAKSSPSLDKKRFDSPVSAADRSAKSSTRKPSSPMIALDASRMSVSSPDFGSPGTSGGSLRGKRPTKSPASLPRSSTSSTPRIEDTESTRVGDSRKSSADGYPADANKQLGVDTVEYQIMFEHAEQAIVDLREHCEKYEERCGESDERIRQLTSRGDEYKARCLEAEKRGDKYKILSQKVQSQLKEALEAEMQISKVAAAAEGKERDEEMLATQVQLLDSELSHEVQVLDAEMRKTTELRRSSYTAERLESERDNYQRWASHVAVAEQAAVTEARRYHEHASEEASYHREAAEALEREKRTRQSIETDVCRLREAKEAVQAAHSRERRASDDRLHLSVAKAAYRAAGIVSGQQMNGSNDDGLLRAPFVAALVSAQSRVAPEQARALWAAAVRRSGKDVVDEGAFCAIVAAVCAGDARAAQFADVSLKDYCTLARAVRDVEDSTCLAQQISRLNRELNEYRKQVANLKHELRSQASLEDSNALEQQEVSKFEDRLERVENALATVSSEKRCIFFQYEAEADVAHREACEVQHMGTLRDTVDELEAHLERLSGEKVVDEQRVSGLLVSERRTSTMERNEVSMLQDRTRLLESSLEAIAKEFECEECSFHRRFAVAGEMADSDKAELRSQVIDLNMTIEELENDAQIVQQHAIIAEKAASDENAKLRNLIFCFENEEHTVRRRLSVAAEIDNKDKANLRDQVIDLETTVRNLENETESMQRRLLAAEQVGRDEKAKLRSRICDLEHVSTETMGHLESARQSLASNESHIQLMHEAQILNEQNEVVELKLECRQLRKDFMLAVKQEYVAEKVAQKATQAVLRSKHELEASEQRFHDEYLSTLVQIRTIGH